MIIVIPSIESHVDEIFETEQESFSLPWTKASLRDIINEKHAICLSALAESERIVGHAYMRHVINEGHIYNVAVAKSHRRLQIGSALIERLIKEAAIREMVGLTLDVRVSNIPAINLYRKFGFISEGIRKNYYEYPTEDGMIMWKYLK